jgi:catechol 2,3-dioxygenase-like lactoylglutathione lyase family enzyme
MKSKKAGPYQAKSAVVQAPKRMPPAKLDPIDHIAIPVRDDDLDDTIDFYLDNFGCEVIYRDDTWGFLRFGNIKLAFVVPDEHPPHLAFVSPRAEEFGILKTHRDGTRSVYISDPSHNTIEIMAEAEAKAEAKGKAPAKTATRPSAPTKLPAKKANAAAKTNSSSGNGKGPAKGKAGKK